MCSFRRRRRWPSLDRRQPRRCVANGVRGLTPLWDIKRLCEFLGVSESHAYNLLAKEALPHVHVGGRLRFIPESVEGWVRSRETVRESEREAVHRALRSSRRRRVGQAQASPAVFDRESHDRLRGLDGAH